MSKQSICKPSPFVVFTGDTGELKPSHIRLSVKIGATGGDRTEQKRAPTEKTKTLRTSVLEPLTIMLWQVLAVLAVSLVPGVLSAPDSQGTEFIIGYQQNVRKRDNPDVQLHVSTSSNLEVHVTVTIPLFNSNWRQDFVVTRGSVHTVTLPHQIRAAGTEKSNKGVYVQASDEISVYAVNTKRASTDAFLGLPVDVLGTEYYAITYRRDPEIMVIATEDDTEVSIKWPPYRINGDVDVTYNNHRYRNGDTMTVTLQKFQTFHVLQKSDNADFTGAYINSTKPIAVTSGNRWVAVPFKTGWADHLTEMLVPVETWGKQFISTSTPGRSAGDLYRIVASEDNTNFSFDGHGEYVLQHAGDYQELEIDTGDYRLIAADKPIMVAMFTETWQNDGDYGGDPAMTLILPVPQYASDYTWSAVRGPKGEFTNMVVVIIDEDKKDGLRLDNEAVAWEEERSVPGSTKVHLWRLVTTGAHNLYHVDTTATFMLYASGTRKADSYSFLGGMRMAKINAVCSPSCVEAGDIVDNDCDGMVDEEILNGQDDDSDGLIDEDLAVPPRVDGQWGDWGSWGACSATCGNHGVKIRTRACDNPAPAYNGYFCHGSCATAKRCNAPRCPRIRDDRTCELTSGQVDTFADVQGVFNYTCLFKAATLNRYRVEGTHRLRLDIYAMYTEVNGNFFVTEVVVAVQEICLHKSPKISWFKVSAADVESVVQTRPEIEAEDLWTTEDAGVYSKYLCFGFDINLGEVSLSIRTRYAGCIPVLSFLPPIQPPLGGTPGLVITAEKRKLSGHSNVRFPNTLCSGRNDKAFGQSFMDLANQGQRILYALLDQNVPQSELYPQCGAAVQAFQSLSEEEKKEAAQRCEGVVDLAGCLSSPVTPTMSLARTTIPGPL